MSRWGPLLGLGLLVAGAGLGLARAERPAVPVDLGAVARLAGDLRAAPAGAALLAGNSHAGIAGEGAPSCTPWVVAGVGGATAASYAALVDRVAAPARLRLAVLLIGTKDILRRNRPLAPARVARFRADTAHVLNWLQARAARVVVTAVPPIGTTAARKLDPAAVAIYSAELRALCQAPVCGFVDPFAALRDGAGGLARPGALRDGLHLADYPTMLSALKVCDSEPLL